MNGQPITARHIVKTNITKEKKQVDWTGQHTSKGTKPMQNFYLLISTPLHAWPRKRMKRNCTHKRNAGWGDLKILN
jgi:hypothetical protein